LLDDKNIILCNSVNIRGKKIWPYAVFFTSLQNFSTSILTI
jgi:hypothetical protein